MASRAIDKLAVVIIDDDGDHRVLLKDSIVRAFASDSREVEVFDYSDPVVGLAELPVDRHAVVFIDYKLGDSTGLDWLGDLHKAGSGPVIVVSSSGDEQIAAEAFRRGAADYVVKSTLIEHSDAVRRCINEAVRRHRLESTNRDLSRRLKLANVELERKNEKLAELTDTAHRFVDDVAHEFRTPLAVIREFASILRDGVAGDLEEKQIEYLEFVIDATRDLAGLIDDFLDSSKLRAQTLRVARRRHDVAGLIQSCRPILESRAAAKDVRLQFEIDEEAPAVFADADKSQRTLINLVVNAVKFSPSGSTVAVSARAVGDAVQISVRDEGPGLPEQAVRDLFGRFRQSDAAPSVIKGFGLGLSIVRELAALNLGDISVESEVGVGSTFSFTLPVDEPRVIAGALIEQTKRRTATAYVCAMRVRRDDLDVDSLIDDLSSICHPTDVAFATPDQSVILAGETSEPLAWKQRLQRVDEVQRDGVAMSIEILDHWPVASGVEPLLGLLSLQLEGARGG